MTDGALTQPTLDHLALASYRAWDNVIRYCYHLGARWLGGPPEDEPTPFYFSQARLAGGAKLEFLQPLDHPGSDFINRFLHRNGPGPHHFTFKVPDIHAAVDEAEAAGYQVVNANFDNPDWQEAFLHPKQSHGIVIQLAQPGGEGYWPDPLPLPPSLQPNLPAIQQIKHLVADLDAAVKLFTGPLAMTLVEQDSDFEGDFAVLEQGPWRLRLIHPALTQYQSWMGGRPGRLLQMSMVVDNPALVPDLRAQPGALEIPPDLNQGTRVMLIGRDD